MSLKIDRVQLEIVIQQDTARQKLLQVEGDMKKVRKELRGLKEGTQEWADKKEELIKLQQQYDALFDQIGIGSLSVKELRNRQKELNTILNQLPGNSPLYNQYKQQLDQVNLRLKELKGTAVETKFSLSKLADGFNKYAAMTAGAVASLTGVTLAARKCVDDFAKLEEAEANVQKYTGMTREEVKELNEEFKKMDTRTARERLNELAADAGRLGIKGKQDLLDFADAANIINVSLGEDLGEDAVKNIGKLAQMFGDDKKLGLKGAMLATASAVNDVAQNSSAAEKYIVEFTARVAGSGKQAGISQTQIMGYASALDQDMQKLEMASTALQNVIMKMYQSPEKFARMAGKSVSEFTELIRTDANEALLQLFETLNQRNGLEELAPIFKEMGLDGVRASGVLSNLASNVDKVRAEQERAAEAYHEGTSAVDEYNVKNNTLQATIEKAKKRFQEVSYELGEQLAPHMGKVITAGGTMVKVMANIVRWFFEYKETIVPTTIAIIAYTAAINASVIADKLKVFWTNKVISSTNKLTAAFKRNPYGLLAVLITAVISRLVQYKRAQDNISQTQKSINNITKQTSQEYDNQAAKIQRLTGVINDENVSNERRKASIEALKEIIPEYNGMLNDEGELINNNTEAIKDYLTQLERQIKMKAAEEELEELYIKQRNTQKLIEPYETEKKETQNKLAAARFVSSHRSNQAGTTGTKVLIGGLDQGLKTAETEYSKALKRLNKTKKELSEINAAIQIINQEIEETYIAEPTKRKGGGGGGKENGNPWDKEMRQLELDARKEQNKLKEKLYKDDAYTEEQYQQDSYKDDIEFLAKKTALLDDYKQDTTQIQGQLLDKMIAESNRVHQTELANEKKHQDELKKIRDSEFKDLDSTYQADKTAIKQAFLNGDIKTEQAYQAKLKELESDYLLSRLNLLRKYGEDASKVLEQIADNELKDAKDEKDAEKSGMEKEIEETPELSGKLDILKKMYDAGLISHEEYEKRKTELTEEYQNKRDEKIKAGFETIAQVGQAATDLLNALMDREISKITQRYDKQIKAAKKAGKDTTKLEEAKEEEINAVKKKYADKQFKAAVLQVTATTAVAAMEAYKAMAGIPFVGPVLGAAAAAAAIASGVAQIQIAKTQQEEAKGLKEGGYSRDYVEGYTTPGNPDDVAGVIPVHKNEFVANHEGVANPHVRQFLDVFNVAQKNGTIRMINTTQILEQIKTRSGRYSGGYTEEMDTPMGGYGNRATAGTENGQQNFQKVIFLLQESNRLLGMISEKDLSIDGRAIRDRIRQIDRLENNVSRRK